MSVLWLWRRELAYLSLFLIIAAILGYFIGYFMHMMVLILVLFIIRLALLLSKLERWLSHGAGGKVPKASGMLGDIYHHLYCIKKNEKIRKKKLGKIIDQFRKSTDVLPDAAVVLGHNNEIEWSNKLAKLVLGIKKSDKGQRLDNLIRSPEFVEFLKNRDEKKKLTMPSPIDDKTILQFRIVSYAISQHLVIAHDVTQQKNMEAMRKNFVDNVSHELRTPLTVLKGYIETLKDMDDCQSTMLTNSLQQMNSQTDRMQYLVDDLLLLARLETRKNKYHCINIVHLLRNICQENDAVDVENKRIALKLESDNKIYGDEQDLRSAFSNLLNNALKYSADNTPVKIVWKKTSQGMILDVIDQGEGLAHSDITRVTERFYRVDVKRSKKLSGTGLGLAIVKHVLIRHDATLEITSTLGKGSRFRCIFPISRIVEI